jgi:hypothetical protein
MPTTPLAPTQLRLTIAPDSLGFASTAELQDLPLPWIGQERAEAAARFGLGMEQPDYNLFVLGEVGSGRTSLLHQAMQQAAAQRSVPPDLCYLHNFDAPERPRALRLPAGQGRVLRQGMEKLTRKRCKPTYPSACTTPTSAAESAAHRRAIRRRAGNAGFCRAGRLCPRALQFRLSRESGHMVFTLIGPQGQPLTEADARALTRAPHRDRRRRAKTACRDRPLPRHHAAPWRANATRRWSNCAARSPNRCSTMNCKKCATACASRSRTPSSWASGWTRYTSRCWTTCAFFIRGRRRRGQRRR